VVVDTDTNEIVAHFPYEEGALVTAVDGSHSGDIGRIDEITVTAGSGDNTVAVGASGASETHRADGEAVDAGFETIEAYVVVIDDQFVDDEDDESADAEAESTDAEDGGGDGE